MSTDGTPPALALLQQALGFWVSRAICVVARLGIADLLKDGPLDTETLAAAAGVHAPSLYPVRPPPATAGPFARGGGWGSPRGGGTAAAVSRRGRNRCGATPPTPSATTSCWWARGGTRGPRTTCFTESRPAGPPQSGATGR